MKIAWLAANASYAHTSLALPLLERATQHLADLEWQVVQVTTKEDMAAAATRIAALNPDVTAATLYLFNRRFVAGVLARVKALCPACVVVVGGPECLGDHREVFREQPWIDIAVRGEGEELFPVLLERLRSGRELDGLEGVSRRGPGGIAADERVAVSLSWETMDSPLASPLFAWDRPFVQIETARGCRFGCTYCTSCGAGPVRYRDLDAVRADLVRIRRHGIREVRVLDRTFNTSAERTAALLDLFAEFAEIRFHLEIHPALLPETVRDKLRQAPTGNLHVEAGLQTSCDASLTAVGRFGSGAAALDGIRFLAQCAEHFDTHVDLLAGLPLQRLADILADAETLVRIGPREIQLEILKALPGTPFRAQAAERGIAVSPLPPYEVLRTPDMSSGDLGTAASLSHLLDQFYNPPELQPALRLAVLHNSASLIELLEMCLGERLLEAPNSLRRRFAILFRFLKTRDREVAEALQVRWMTLGLSPQHGICRATRWTEPIPETARRIQGNPRGLDSATCRIWHLDLTRAEYWFVYHRGASTRRAGALYTREHRD